MFAFLYFFSSLCLSLSISLSFILLSFLFFFSSLFSCFWQLEDTYLYTDTHDCLYFTKFITDIQDILRSVQWRRASHACRCPLWGPDAALLQDPDGENLNYTIMTRCEQSLQPTTFCTTWNYHYYYYYFCSIHWTLMLRTQQSLIIVR